MPKSTPVQDFDGFLLIEEHQPAFYSAALTSLRSVAKNCQIVFIQAPSQVLPKDLQSYKLYYEIFPTPTPQIWTTLEATSDAVDDLLHNSFPDQADRLAVKKASKYCFMFCAYALNLTTTTNKPVFAVTRWSDLYRYLGNKKIKVPTVVPIHNSNRTFLSRLMLPLLEPFIYACHTLRNTNKPSMELAPRFSRPSTPHRAVIYNAQNKTDIQVVSDLFSGPLPFKVHFHFHFLREKLTPSEDQSLENLKKLALEMGHTWSHQRHLGVAFYFRLLMRNLRFIVLNIFSNNINLRLALLRMLRRVWEWEHELARLMDKVPCSLLVVQDERAPNGFKTAELAKSHGTKTLNLCHGLMIPREPLLSPFPNFDLWGVFGLQTRRDFESLGVQSQNIAELGHPHLSHWAQVFEQEMAKDPPHVTRPILGSAPLEIEREDAKSLHLLFVSQPFTSFFADRRYAIVDWLKGLKSLALDLGLPEIKLTIKLHPIELDDVVKIGLADVRNVQIFHHEKSVLELLPQADFVVGVNSTALLEAIAHGKKIICFDETGFFDEFFACGMALKPYLGDKLKSWLRAPIEASTPVQLEQGRKALEHIFGDFSKNPSVLTRKLIERISADTLNESHT